MANTIVKSSKKGTAKAPATRNKISDSKVKGTEKVQQRYADNMLLEDTEGKILGDLQSVRAEDGQQKDERTLFGDSPRNQSVDTRFGSNDRFDQDDRFGDDRFIDDEFDDDLTEKQMLTAPEPREGMVQRWVRVADVGSDGSDISNYARKSWKGWTPRPLDTFPDMYKRAIPRRGKSVSDDQGGYQVAELILMEMPEETHHKLKRQGRRKIDKRTAALDDALYSKQTFGSQYGEFSVDKRRVTATRGRTPRVAED